MKNNPNRKSPISSGRANRADDDWRWAQNLPTLRRVKPLEILLTKVVKPELTAEDFEEFLTTGNATELQRAIVRVQIAHLRERDGRRPTFIERIFGLWQPNTDALQTLRAITEVNNAASTAIASDYDLQHERIRRHGVQQEFRANQTRHKTTLVEQEIRYAEAEERLQQVHNRATGVGTSPVDQPKRRLDPREREKVRREDEIATAEHEAKLSEFELRKARNAAAAKNLRQPPPDEFAEALAEQAVLGRRLKRLDDTFNPKLADAERKHGSDSEQFQSLLTQYNRLRLWILEGKK